MSHYAGAGCTVPPHAFHKHLALAAVAWRLTDDNGVAHGHAAITWLCITCRSLQDEDAQLSSKVPLPVNRLCRVRQWLAGKVASLDAETAALEGKQMVRTRNDSWGQHKVLLNVYDGKPQQRV